MGLFPTTLLVWLGWITFSVSTSLITGGCPGTASSLPLLNVTALHVHYLLASVSLQNYSVMLPAAFPSIEWPFGPFAPLSFSVVLPDCSIRWSGSANFPCFDS